MNFYFNKQNEIKKYPTSYAIKEWEKILQKEDLVLEDILNWHNIYTPWFQEEVILEISKKEFDNIKKNKKSLL